jgi:hypothetical protein
MEFTQKSGLRKLPRPVWGLVACILLVAAGYGLYWNFLAGQFRDGLERWAEVRRAEGYKVDYGPVEVAGFPFWLRVVMGQPVLSKSGEKQSWNWRGPALTISARPWRVTHTKAQAPGRHLVTVTTQARVRTLDINAGSLNVSLKWAVSSGLPLEMRIEGKDISYRSAPVAGLGRRTETLSLHAEVTGTPPKSLGAAVMSQWRDDGGTVEIRSLNVRHGPMEIDGDGTIALDGDLQPQAAFSMGVRGFMDAVDGLQAAGVIKPRKADVMKMVLAVLSGGKADAKGELLKVPVSIQDEIIYMGPVVVGRVPYMNWPTGG